MAVPRHARPFLSCFLCFQLYYAASITDWEGLAVWAHNQGVTHDKVNFDLRQPGGDGLKLSVLEPMSEGEPLLSVPANITMCHQTLTHRSHVGGLLQFLDDCSAETTNPQCENVPMNIIQHWVADSKRLSLILGLYYEAFVSGEESFWAPYLRTLPTKLNHLPGSFKHGSRAHVFVMSSSATYAAYQVHRFLVRNTVDMLVELVDVFQAHLGLNISGNATLKAVHKKMHWATLTVFSRAVSVNAAGISLALVPLADSIQLSVNLSTSAWVLRQPAASALETSNSTGVLVQVVASRDMGIGELVTIPPQQKCAAQAFAETGHVVQSPQHMCASLSVYLPFNHSDSLFPIKAKVLALRESIDISGLKGDVLTIPFTCTQAAPMPMHEIGVLRVMQMTEAQLRMVIDQNLSVRDPLFADNEYQALTAFLRPLRIMKSEMMDQMMQWSGVATDEVLENLRLLHIGSQVSLDSCINAISTTWQSILLDATTPPEPQQRAAHRLLALQPPHVRVFENRLEMVRSLVPHGASIMEIGTFRGEFASEILQAVSPTRLHLVDPWVGSVTSGDQDGSNSAQYSGEELFSLVTNTFAGLPEVVIHRAYSHQVVPLLENATFDAIYVDGDHGYHGCLQDLEMSWPKLRSGGWLMGHDIAMNYVKAGQRYEFGVQAAVRQFGARHAVDIGAIALDGCVGYAIQKP